MAVQPDLSRLKVILLNSGLQHKNNALYQVIIQLIEATKQLQGATATEIITVSAATSNLSNKALLTHANEAVDLPSSRRLLAGTNVSFDDTVANQRTISASGAPNGYWTVLTDGDIDETNLIFAGGEAIAMFVPL